MWCLPVQFQDNLDVDAYCIEKGLFFSVTYMSLTVLHAVEKLCLCTLIQWNIVLYRWTGDLRVRALVQTSPEVVKVWLVRQREAAEVSYTRGNCHRSLAVLCHQGPQLPLWAAQRHHVRYVSTSSASRRCLLLVSSTLVTALHLFLSSA